MDLSTVVSNLTLGYDQLLGETGHNPDTECRAVHSYNSSWQCHFVNSTDDCYVQSGYVQYIHFIYCTMGHLIPLAVTILIFWLLFLFVALAVAADNFFCPSLEVIAKVLHMSDNIAGVTLLAFGNGAPDVFSAISAVNNMKDGDVGMVFGALLGAGVFLTTVVVGAVTLVGPFHAMERPFLRDIIFYIATVFFTFYVCYDRTISFFESLTYIVTYIVYVIVVITGRVLYQKYFRPPTPVISREVREESTTDSENPMSRNGSVENLRSSPPKRNNGYDERTPLLQHQAQSIDSPVSFRDDTTRQVVGSEESTTTTTICGDFLLAVSPIDVEEWKDREDKYHLRRIYAVFKAPALFILKLTVPLVDYNSPKHNWNKPLNLLHCVITPVFCVFAASSDFALHELAPGFPVCLLFLIAGIILAIVVFFTSQRQTPPVYNEAFAFIGFFSAVLWIKNIANEIVNILQAAGVVFSISNTVLGLTFLAWGNSIGDLISDVAVAKRGFPRAGLSACFGGPLFNTLLGVGIPFTMAAYKNGGVSGSIAISFSAIQIFLFIGLSVSLLSSFIIIPLLGFRLRRPYGVFLIALYAVFLTLALLIESHAIRWTI